MNRLPLPVMTLAVVAGAAAHAPPSLRPELKSYHVHPTSTRHLFARKRRPKHKRK